LALLLGFQDPGGVMLELRDVSISLNDQVLLRALRLGVAAGEVVTVMGQSGSGKSSLLSYIGGDLNEAFQAEGSVLLDGIPLQDLPPERRGIARLFQDDLLFPHMTVGENLLFAIPRLPNAERMAMMRMALQRAELEGFEDRAPHTLSGGQRQRVALMRALLAKPKAVLLDEPFGKLDRALRQSMRDYVFGHIKARGIPALLVTHDREDAPPGGRVFEISDAGELQNV
jgi:putative thiamine transport system ATP-binding protein